MNRYAVRIGSSAFALLLLVLGHTAAAAAGPDHAVYSFQDQRITFNLIDQGAGQAVAVDDPGVRAFFAAIGASATWQHGQRYILITTAEPLVVSFALGDTRYDVGPVTQNAPFAPFLLEGHAYVPFDQLIRSLGFSLKGDVLQPQLTSVDVQSAPAGTKLIARGGMPLNAKVVSDTADKLTIAFDGVGSSLPPSRLLSGPVQRIDVRTEGSVTQPRTLLTLLLAAGTTHTGPGTDDQRDVTIGFNGATIAQAAAEPIEATPAPSPQAPAPALGNAQVGGVATQNDATSVTVRVSVNGTAQYEWHRLRPPDNRFWLDIHGSKLTAAPADMPGSGTINAIRIRQQSADTVRIALSLDDYRLLTVTPDAGGISIVVQNAIADLSSTARTGSGTTGSAAMANAAPLRSQPWKFGQPPPGTKYVAGNGRLIVIDPGHGGSDWGTYRGDDVEKNLTLDMSKRVRDILVARGWQVVMTRETDRDVLAPNDSDHDELQARDDIANNKGARLFLSIHVNAYINSGPHGATVYYYKPVDYGFAQALERRIAQESGIKDDGTVKDKLYVVHHANMPAALVETAFISNPDDRLLLESSQWRQKMARAIADGVSDYAGPPPSAKDSGNF